MTHPPKPPQFPTHAHPRVWLITATTSPIGTAIARHALSHGDFVVAGVEDVDILSLHNSTPSTYNNGNGGGEEEEGDEMRASSGKEERGEEFREFWAEVMGKAAWRERCRGVGLDGRCEDPYALR